MTCKNCKNDLLDPQLFCNNCGAKVIKNRLTLRNLFSDFIGQFFNYDNKAFKTITHLLTEPENVILGYIKGVRKRYINPVSFYAISITISGLLLFLLNKFFANLVSLEWMGTNVAGAGEDGFRRTMEYQGIISLVSVPVYAFLSKLMFLKNKKLNFTEHVVAYLYMVGAFSIISFILTVISLILGFNYFKTVYFLLVLQIIYVAYCLKRIFSLSVVKIFTKTLLFFLLVVSIYIVGAIIYVGFLYLTGGIEALRALAPPA